MRYVTINGLLYRAGTIDLEEARAPKTEKDYQKEYDSYRKAENWAKKSADNYLKELNDLSRELQAKREKALEEADKYHKQASRFIKKQRKMGLS